VAPVRLGGLPPARIYEVAEVDLAGGPGAPQDKFDRRPGDALTEEGLEWHLTEPCTARIWVLRSL
jgi:hypothetical protein